MAFMRRFADIERLQAEPLFNKRLLPDIVERFDIRRDRGRDVFPAVRNNRMDFYHKGGKLFTYDGRIGFTTHHKYASVIRSDDKKPYVAETNLQAISSFVEGYERIKENCSLYSGAEAQGVAQVYGRFSCAKHAREHHVVVLDIEVSLRRNGSDDVPEPGEATRASSDRIDLLLFDTKSRLLRFFEAKDFSNGEIRAAKGYTPRIVKQMERYQKQLDDAHIREEILSAYKAHADVINRLFDPEMPLPMPEHIDPNPRLLLFGFDLPQLTGKLKGEVKCLEDEHGLSVYPIGEIKQVNPGNLFSGGRKRW
jgi:hypothetical protein